MGQASPQADDLPEGWEWLFDGKSAAPWRGYGMDSLSANWQVRDGALCADGTKGDIVTRTQYEDFELSLEWRISQGGNSGLFYHVKEVPGMSEIWRTGIEFQLMDNSKNPMGQAPIKAAGSLYQMYGPKEAVQTTSGVWNRARLVVEQGQVTYWINGKQVLAYQLWTEPWYQDRETCLHNATRKPFWGEFRQGHIALQDEGYPVSYRNIKIREIPNPSYSSSSPEFKPILYQDQVSPVQKEGHHTRFLLNEWWGTKNGFKSMHITYTDTAYVHSDPHPTQEMFYLLAGNGMAYVGDKVFPVYPGACWWVPVGVRHGVKALSPHEPLSVFVVHGGQ